MPRIGFTRQDTVSYEGFPDDVTYMSLNNRPMPANGWIVAHATLMTAETDTLSVSPVLYKGPTLANVGPRRATGGGLGYESASCNVRASAGEVIRWGYCRFSPYGSNETVIGYMKPVSGHTVVTYKRAGSPPTSPPNPLPAATSGYADGANVGYFDYVANAAPSMGGWRSTTAAGVITTTTPTFSGFLYHGSGDEAYDETTSVHLRIWRTDNNLDVYNSEFAPTSTEATQNYFSRTPVTLTPGLSYAAQFRHKDTWGVYSVFSETRTFTVAQGPNAPDLTAPFGKINVVSGYQFEGLYSHPNGAASNAIQVQLLNAAGTTVLQDSGTVAKTVNPGSTWTLAGFGAALSWGTSYTWRARFRDVNNLWGPYSTPANFKTNAFPSAPTNLSPSGGQKTGLRTLAATVSDPDSDPIFAAQVELVNASSGSLVAGYPKAMSVDPKTYALSFEVSLADLAFDTTYRWRARASDNIGPGYGAWSPYAEFFYASSPTVSVLSPGPEARVNQVLQPSAEYSPSSPSWRETNRVEGSDFVEVVGDNDSHSGAASWRANASATGTNAFEEISTSPIDPTTPYLARVAAKKESGIASASFQVLCYDATQALIATLHPSSVAPLQSGDIPGAWAEYGGRINAQGGPSPAWPAGAVSKRFRFVPSSGSEAVVRFDAFSFEDLPALSVADWEEAQAWYGYADGDGPEGSSDGYLWAGTAGESESLVLPVLTDFAPSVAVSYSPSPGTGAAKSADRLFVERWDLERNAFVSHSDTGWVAGARTVIPVPAGILANEARYRLRVRVRDAGNIEAESDSVRFDTRYVGPAELGILTISPDPSRAEINISHEPSTLSAVEFGGVEVAVEADDEPRRVFLLNTDPTNPTATYPFPKPGTEYVLLVRQVRVVGGYRLQGRWTRARATVETEFEFLKDAENPSRLVAYETQASKLPDFNEDRPGETYLPWGLEKPVHVRGEALFRNGQANVEIYVDAQGVGTADERWAMLKSILKDRPKICLLTNVPDRDKIFASVEGQVKYSLIPTRTKTAEFSWEETAFSEEPL